MSPYDKAAVQLETFIRKRLPVKAQALTELTVNDADLASYFEQGFKVFNGVIYYPRTREVYCSFYDHSKQEAVLMPVVELVFERRDIQDQVEKFKKKFYAA